jgi:hypothetical protein
LGMDRSSLITSMNQRCRLLGDKRRLAKVRFWPSPVNVLRSLQSADKVDLGHWIYLLRRGP